MTDNKPLNTEIDFDFCPWGTEGSDEVRNVVHRSEPTSGHLLVLFY